MAIKVPTDAQLAVARRRSEAKAKLPTALTSATLDEKAKALRLHFRAGFELTIPVKAIDELAKVPLVRLRDVTTSAAGDDLVFREFGEAFYVPGLLRDLFGDGFSVALSKIGRTSRTRRARSAQKIGRKSRPRKAAA